MCVGSEMVAPGLNEIGWQPGAALPETPPPPRSASGRERGNTAFARQAVAEKRDLPDVKGHEHKSVCLILRTGPVFRHGV
jgi:hypothetical protein